MVLQERCLGERVWVEMSGRSFWRNRLAMKNVGGEGGISSNVLVSMQDYKSLTCRGYGWCLPG